MALGTGLSNVSFTIACRRSGKSVLTCVACGEPPVATIVSGDVAVFLSWKSAGCATPSVDARTTKLPALVFAMKRELVANPKSSVRTVSTPFSNLPLGPVSG